MALALIRFAEERPSRRASSPPQTSAPPSSPRPDPPPLARAETEVAAATTDSVPCGDGGATAADRALHWLARHQSEDGHWDPSGFGACCKNLACPGAGAGKLEVSVTALAALAILEAGYTPMSRVSSVDPIDKKTRRLGDTVRNAVKWLLERQDAEGGFGSGPAALFEQAVATLALVEAYGVTNARLYREPTARAVGALLRRQALEEPSNATFWAVLALEAAAPSFAVDAEALARARRSLAASQGAAAHLLADALEHRDSDDATDAAREERAPLFAAPPWRRSKPLEARPDALTVFADAIALVAHMGPHDKSFSKWREGLSDTLNGSQHRGGCLDGSWDPLGPDWDRAGGRVFATALSLLALEAAWEWGGVPRAIFWSRYEKLRAR